MTYYINLRPASPLSRILAAVLGVLAVIGAVFFGLLILAFILGAALFLWLGIWLRMLWLKRKLGSEFDGASSAERGSRDKKTISAEYTVIDRRRD